LARESTFAVDVLPASTLPSAGLLTAVATTVVSPLLLPSSPAPPVLLLVDAAAAAAAAAVVSVRDALPAVCAVVVGPSFVNFASPASVALLPVLPSTAAVVPLLFVMFGGGSGVGSSSLPTSPGSSAVPATRGGAGAGLLVGALERTRPAADACTSCVAAGLAPPPADSHNNDQLVTFPPLATGTQAQYGMVVASRTYRRRIYFPTHIAAQAARGNCVRKLS
jgi:hypothetical protein